MGTARQVKLSAVIDANVVIGLCKGNVFSLLPQLFHPLYLPKSVEYEVVQLGRGRPGQAELQQALTDGWIVRASVPGKALSTDQQTIEVAKAHHVEYVLTGDVEVAKMAADENLKQLSALDIIALLKLAGHIASAGSVLDAMTTTGFGISRADRQVILGLAGEE